ncbi:YhcN/YlaJ family sporulation lipoprotein [Pullulanibacillus camelliae]|nr:YhcN/YlaJ family sporulation lipoprotein [Pullulanibacillus camelliae]
MTGCGTDKDNNNAMGDNGVRNIGYYTDKNRPNVVPRNDVYDNNASLNNNRNYNDVNDKDSVAADSALSRRIASQVARLNNVNDASAFTDNNTVVIGATLDKDVNNKQAVEQSIRSTAKQLAPDKNIRVVTDRKMVNRIADVNDRLDNGAPIKEVRSDISGIINDLGNALQRPFQNNAK